MPLPLTLQRFERIGWELWLAPAVAAAVWGVLLSQANGQVALARSLVFVGGPIVLLAGLFERLGAFLHAPQRRALLPLPLRPALHFAAARLPHRVGLGATAGFGTAAVLLAALADLRPAGVPWATVGLLVADWLWLVGLAALTEPAIAGGAAWLGRRFAPQTAAHRLQLQAGGGWTLPEAVVHLYAPALGIGVATALAMPGQLTLDRLADAVASVGSAGPITPGIWAASLVPIALALGLRAWAGHGYARGMFEATAWLHQAMRTLAGPPVPEPAPGWIARLPDPALRLWTLQLWRITPVPSLRLWALLGVGAWIGWTGTLALPQAAVLVALCALWLVPAVRVVALRKHRGAYLAALPLPAPHRAGRCPAAAWLLLLPPLVALGVAGLGVAVRPAAAETTQVPR